MKKRMFCPVFLLFILSGCMTQPLQFPSLTNTSAASAAFKSDSPVVGFAQIRDNRTDQKAGRIGGLNVSAGKDMIDYMQQRIRTGLYDQGFNVVDAPNPSEMKTANVGEIFKNNVVVTILQSASIATADSIMFPAKSDIDFIVKVYDPKGQALYEKQYHGESSKHLGLVTSGKQPGNAMAIAVDNGIQELIKDSNFLAVLK